jgi:hypothetical protein
MPFTALHLVFHVMIMLTDGHYCTAIQTIQVFQYIFLFDLSVYSCHFSLSINSHSYIDNLKC